MKNKKFSSFDVLLRSARSVKDELKVSLKLLLYLTIALAILYWIVEGWMIPYSDVMPWDTFFWMLAVYVEDIGGLMGDGPQTYLGQVIVTLAGYVGVLIFAIPVGLVACGFDNAILEKKQEENLIVSRGRLRKAFRRIVNKELRGYLNTLPDGGGEKLSRLNFVPRYQKIIELQAMKGMSEQDIMDAVNAFPEFRIQSVDNNFVVAYNPVNRPYGCCINRHSPVTIVVPSSYAEVGIGWWAYYLAKFGGFNFVSKDIEVDPDEADSFYNLPPEPRYEMMPYSHYASDRNGNKEALQVLQRKQYNRDCYLNDLKMLAAEAGSARSWIISFGEHNKTATNTLDFHFAYCDENNQNSTIVDTAVYNDFFAQFVALMQEGFGKSADKTSRYPLSQGEANSNFMYYLKNHDILSDFNGLNIRVARGILREDKRNIEMAFRISQLINNAIAHGNGLRDEEVAHFLPGFGYDKSEFDFSLIK